MKKKAYLFAAATLALTVASCEQDYMLYDTTQVDSVFFNYVNSKSETDSIISYNFGYDIATQHEVDIPVSLMGIPKSEARKIDIRVMSDQSDMVEGTHFTIARAEIDANKVQDTVKIMLLRDNDPEIQEKEKTLRIQIVENGDLRPTGMKEFTIKYSDIRPTTRPDWWSTYAGLPVYSFENAQLFFKYFYDLMPKGNQDVFNEMISAYGDYFVNAKSLQGPFAMYDAILAKYVCIPMYNDTKDTIEWQSVPQVN